MTVYKYIDSRNLAFLLATVFLFLFAVGPEIPTFYFNYVPIICGSLVLAQFGIYTSSQHLLWPAIVTTGFFALVYGAKTVSALPYLLIPKAKLNWDQCKEFLKYFNCSGLEDDESAAVAIAKTASCYQDIHKAEVYVYPFMWTAMFGASFILFVKAQSRIRSDEQTPVLPVRQGKEAAVHPFNLPLSLRLAFFVSLIVYFFRATACFVWPAALSMAEKMELFLIPLAFLASFSVVAKEPAGSPLFLPMVYAAIKAIIDSVYAICLLFYMKPDQWTVCFSQLESLNATMGSQLNIASASANRCFQEINGATYIDVFHSQAAGVLFTLLFFFWEAVVSWDEDRENSGRRPERPPAYTE